MSTPYTDTIHETSRETLARCLSPPRCRPDWSPAFHATVVADWQVRRKRLELAEAKTRLAKEAKEERVLAIMAELRSSPEAILAEAKRRLAVETAAKFREKRILAKMVELRSSL